GDQRLALAQGDLGLLGAQGQGALPGLARGLGAVAVQQGKAAGVLGDGGAHQAPDRRRGGVGALLGAGGDRSLGGDHQARVLPLLFAQPLLDQGQGLGGRLQGGLGRGQGGVCSQLAQLAGGVLGVCRGRAGGLPGDAQQVLVGAPGAEGGEGDLAGGEGADAPQRGALLIGEGQREALAL